MKEKPVSYVSFCVLSLLAVLLFIFAAHDIYDLDIWLHLKTGELLLKNRAFIYNDPYVYTLNGVRWINMEWLSQILFFTLYRLGGAFALIMLKYITLCGAFFLIVGFARKEHLFVTCAMLSAAFVASEPRFLVRPHIFSLLFTSIFLYSLLRFCYRKKSHALYILPVIQILWVNMHGYFLIGPVMVSCFVLGESLSRWMCIHNKRGTTPCLELCDLRRLGMLGLVLAGCCLLNPYFLEGALYPFRVIANTYFHAKDSIRYITELSPLVEGMLSKRPVTFFYFHCLFILTAVSFLATIRRFRLSLFLIFSASLYLAFSMRRHIDLFAIVALWAYIQNWEDATQFSESSRNRWYLRSVRWVKDPLISLCLTLPAFVFGAHILADGYYFPNHPARFGFGVSHIMYPLRAAAFFKENCRQGRLFNTSAFGSYLIGQLYPRQVFIDGRTEYYSPEFLDEYIHLNRDVWHRWQEKYDFDLAFIHHHFGVSWSALITLFQDVHWELIYVDDTAAIFVKKDRGHEALIQKYKIDPARFFPEYTPAEIATYSSGLKKRPCPWPYLRLADFFTALGFHENALYCYKKALELEPRLVSVYHHMAVLYASLLEYDAALGALQTALALRPGDRWLKQTDRIIRRRMQFFKEKEAVLLEAYYGERPPGFFIQLGDALAAEKMPDEALRVYLQGVECAPQSEVIFHRAGKLYYENGRLREALAVYEKGLNSFPDSALLGTHRGVILAELKEYVQAQEQFERVLQRDERSFLALRNLGTLYAEQGRYREALAVWDKALAIKPDNALLREFRDKAEGLLREGGAERDDDVSIR
ncbi:MAG: tetratricopeptide repeat protein [Candidatus Omnitrophica bacterium]|nr:tetratricopeptide repeat protein [Candidatus Omnitrophota bacterium]